jgi:dTDP-4-amino-4,6-dideoxygalactose transaminase
MVTTNDPEVAERSRGLRDHGRGDKYTHLHVGMGERLDTIQAAILRVKLRRLDEWTEARRGVADSYNRRLKESGLGLPQVMPDSTHVYHLYVVRVPLRDQVLGLMQKNGVSVGVHYPLPVHLQPGYRFLGYRKGDFPNAEQAAEEVLSLPMYPELQPEQITSVVGALSDALRLPGGP